ncbi:MAG: hypothetical protein AAGH82_03095 [Pseudomonadota bacterium]
MPASSSTPLPHTRPITLLHRGEALAANAMFSLLARLSVKRASALGGWLVEAILSRTKRGRRAEQQIAAVFPNMAASDVKRMAAKSWNVFGRSLAEIPHLPEIISDPDRLILKNEDVLARVKERDTGTIYVASHLGNWELLPGTARSVGQPFHGFYRPLSNAILEERLRSMRQAAAGDGELLPAASRGVASAMAALRRGETVGILGDLFEGNGVNSTFLGFPARTNALPATLSLRCGAQIIIVTIKRLPGVRFELSFEEVETVRTGDRAHDIAATTHAINERLEKAIRATPDQWLWSTNRWKGLDLSKAGQPTSA